MPASLSGEFNLQGFTDGGVLASNYRLYTYTTGTTTHKAAYTDAAASVPHTYASDGIGGQYIALNARGELPSPLFLTTGAYDIALKTPAGATVWTRYAKGMDDASATVDTAIRADFASTSDAAKGDALLGVLSSLTGGVARTQHAKNADTINVNDFSGVDPTGATSSTAGILAACLAAATAGKVLRFSGAYKLSTALALTSSHNGLRWSLDGATITKGANIDLVTVTSCDNFSIDGVGVIDGLMTSYTGRGFLVSGTSSNFYVGPGIVTKAFASAHFEFGQNAGSYAKLMNDMLADASQTAPEMILKSGATDTGAMQRYFAGRIQGHITLTGALATFIHCPLVNYVSIDDNCAVTIVVGASWSNNGTPIPTISGAGTIIAGCRFSDNVTLGSGMSGSFVGNAQNGGTFTDNTVGGNAIVVHHRLSTAYQLIQKQAITTAANQGELNAESWSADAGDAVFTYTADSNSPTIIFFNTPLTASRLCDLQGGTRNGQKVRIVRTSAATGAFNVVIGATGLNLATAGSWADVVYTGSGWRVSGGSIAP